MSAEYGCPDCDGRLATAGVANAWRCRRCDLQVVEAVDEAHQHVREFYRRVAGRWGGVRA